MARIWIGGKYKTLEGDGPAFGNADSIFNRERIETARLRERGITVEEEKRQTRALIERETAIFLEKKREEAKGD